MVVGMMMTMMRRRRRCYFCFRGREKGVSMAWRRVVSCWAAGSPLSVVVGNFRYSWIDRSGAEVVDKMFVDNNLTTSSLLLKSGGLFATAVCV